MGVYSPLLKGRQYVFCSGHVFVRSGHVLFVAAMFFLLVARCSSMRHVLLSYSEYIALNKQS